LYDKPELVTSGFQCAGCGEWNETVVDASVGTQQIRARREARVLETAFGDAYRTYRSKTWS